MIEYITKQTVRLGGGDIVGLTEDLVKDRESSLKDMGNGIYKVLTPIQFKAGEKIRLKKIPKQARGLICLPDDIDNPELDMEEELELKNLELEEKQEIITSCEAKILALTEELKKAYDKVEEFTSEIDKQPKKKRK